MPKAKIKQKRNTTIAKRFRISASGLAVRTRMHRQHHRGHLTNRQKAAGRVGTVAVNVTNLGLVKIK